MKFIVRIIPTIVLAALLASVLNGQSRAAACQPAGPLTRLAGLPEASGLAVSRRTPGRLWSHNDSGEPAVVALDARGLVAGRVQLTGARVDDWEAIAVGPCGSGSCIYVADIGDNAARRDHITIYRAPEPQSVSGSVAADVFQAAYPDGAQDAEALLIAGDGRLYIVTKGETGPVAIYRFPAQLQSGARMRLERVGAPSAERDAASRITDGAVSPDGEWAVLRTRSGLSYYRASDLFAGRWRVASRVDLTPLKEPQGEGVALGADDMVFVAGEGGARGQPGTFARFTCAPGGNQKSS